MYPTLRQDLTSLLLDCQGLKIEYDVDKLDRPIDIIQEELQKSELMLSELEESHNWRKAIHEISKMVDSMDRLLKRYGELYSQVREDMKRSSKRRRFGSEDGTEGGTGELENREQQEVDILSERFDPTDIPVHSTKGGASGTKKLRSEEDKFKSRQKKKEKRRPHGRGGD